MHLPVLVIGGTRSTGLHVVRALLQRGCSVRVLARKPQLARRTQPDGVDIVEGDLTKPETLIGAVAGVSHLVVTAGVRSGRFARESLVKATEYEGILHTISAARAQGFSGRLVYMTSVGVTRRSWSSTALNIWKGNTLVWRLRAEEAIRSSGIDYTIVRAAFLVNRPAGDHEICVMQGDAPLSLRERIARADVAGILVEAVFRPQASRATLAVRWCDGPRRSSWARLFANLAPDGASQR